MSFVISSRVKVNATCEIEFSPLYQTFPHYFENYQHFVAIYDSNTRIFQSQIQVLAEKLGMHVDHFVLENSGESLKSFPNYLLIVDRLNQLGFMRRKSCLVAVGGGTVTDLVGFVAATYQRGVNYINIPTTLLGMIDASIGGKVAINLVSGKHLIGAFHYPHSVLIDIDTLKTLPQRQFEAALGELWKVALIASDSELFELLSNSLEAFRQRDSFLIETLIIKAIRIKLSFVETDWVEKDLDRYLNLGHEIAHAIEAALEFDDSIIMHGEAVTVGILVVLFLALQRHLISEDLFNNLFKKISHTLPKFGESLRLPASSIVSNHINIIEKIRDGNLRVVAPYQQIGCVQILHDVSVTELLDCYDQVITHLRL